MFRRALLLVTALCTIAAPAHAQFVVIDPANLVQTTLIAYRVQQHYTELRAQYLTVLRMAQRLGSLDRFRTPPIALTSHDPSRWDFGRPWIQALNSGDPTGSAYLSTALPLLRPTTTPPTLSAAARQMLQRQYATVEITDSVAMMGGHQVALARGYHGQLQSAVESLQNDVLNPRLAVSRDDGNPRQDRGRGASRATAGHALEPAPIARPRAAARTRKAAARHRSRHHQHAARHLAGCACRERGVRRRHRRRASDVASAVAIVPGDWRTPCDDFSLG